MSKKNVNVVKTINVKEIKDPTFLAFLNYKEMEGLASEIRKEIIEQVSINGGHLSSNLGMVELTIALHRCFDLSKDKIIFDVGHQCYTHKILTGRSLTDLRKKDGVSGFQKINESIYDSYEAGHSSTSISAAYGFAVARDLNNENHDVIAVIGDGSIVSGLAFEGLNNIPHSNHKVIIVLNDNEMSISKPTGGLGKVFAKWSASKGYIQSKERYSRGLNKTKFGKAVFNVTRRVKNWASSVVVPHNMFHDMGYYYIGPIDGHNIKSLEKAFENAKKTPKSVIIHVNTIKGKGYEPAERDETGYWHGVSPFEIETGKPLDKHEGYISWSHIYGDLIYNKMKEDEKAVVISPATLKGSSLDKVFDDFKNRAFDVGIAEEHAVTMSSSLALAGYHPIVSIYSTFMQRAFDEISHDVARMNLNVTFVVDRAGLVGADGETHQGIYDVSFLVNTPNCVVTMPSNISEAKALLDMSIDNHGAFFIRIPRSNEKIIENINSNNLTFGKWIKTHEDASKNVAILAVGPIQNKLQSLLLDNNALFTMFNCIFVKPIDVEAVKECLEYNNIVIYDPYSTEGGFVTPLIKLLSELNYKGKIKSFSIPLTFVKQATIEEQQAEFNISPIDVINYIKSL